MVIDEKWDADMGMDNFWDMGEHGLADKRSAGSSLRRDAARKGTYLGSSEVLVWIPHHARGEVA